MNLKSHTKRPPCGWVFRQKETGWQVSMSTVGKLISAIRDHRIENHLDRTSDKEIREDLESHICDLLKGKWALWDFCNTTMPRPSRASITPPSAPAVNPFPARGQKTTPKAQAIVEQISARKAKNAEIKKSGKPAKRPCKTCGKRSGS